MPLFIASEGSSPAGRDAFACFGLVLGFRVGAGFFRVGDGGGVWVRSTPSRLGGRFLLAVLLGRLGLIRVALTRVDSRVDSRRRLAPHHVPLVVVAHLRAVRVALRSAVGSRARRHLLRSVHARSHLRLRKRQLV